MLERYENVASVVDFLGFFCYDLLGMNKEFRVLGLVFDLGYTIAVPLIFFALGGRFLDKKLESSPLFLLIGIFAALAVSGYGIYKKIKQIEVNGKK